MILCEIDVNCQKKGAMQTNFTLPRPFPILLFFFPSDSSLEFSVLLEQFWEPSSLPSVVLNLPDVSLHCLSSQGVFVNISPVVRLDIFSLKPIKILTACFKIFFGFSLFYLFILIFKGGRELHTVLLSPDLKAVTQAWASKTGLGSPALWLWVSIFLFVR